MPENMTDKPEPIDIEHYLDDPDLAIGDAKLFIERYGPMNPQDMGAVRFLTWTMGYTINPALVLKWESLDGLAAHLGEFKMDTNHADQKVANLGGIHVQLNGWLWLREDYLKFRDALKKHIIKGGSTVSEYLASQHANEPPHDTNENT